MKKYFPLSILLPMLSLTAIAQKDTTTILPNDIYSNFTPNSQTNLKPYSYFVSSDKKDTIKILSHSYEKNINIADKYYKKSEYSTAANIYTLAFRNNNDLGKVDDRFKTACCYAMLNEKDSAFIQLERITTKGMYINLDELEKEKRLIPLHNDPRWILIIDKIKKNRSNLQEEINNKLQETQ